jgi:hypothetical protein
MIMGMRLWLGGVIVIMGVVRMRLRHKALPRAEVL